ncbi:hypothetical protein X739_00530 [Mesorhizobium sp. LNHC220B00]|nr:DUF3307 domain-containing protein [Mesorhizobium sp. LNHC220B00]ESY88338.1 hypothetical protein X739_00530 [Mesorhizobium sp. LNHC220B00]
MHDLLMMALLLLAGHWVADYPLQGDFLAVAKAQGPLRVYHLMAHSGIHAGAVAVITGSVWMGLAEFVVHAVIDENKTHRRISFATDQALHIACKGAWLAVWALS